MGEADPHPSPIWSFLYLAPPPNLHFNLNIPGDPRETGPPVPAVDRKARHSVFFLCLLCSQVGAAAHPGPGQGGAPPARRGRRRPHREGLTAAQASTMSRDLCPFVVYNRRLFRCSG